MNTTFDWNSLQYMGVLALLAFLIGCSQAVEPRTVRAAAPHELAAQPASEVEDPVAKLPPMDAEAPEIFETASFGLG